MAIYLKRAGELSISIQLWTDFSIDLRRSILSVNLIAQFWGDA